LVLFLGKLDEMNAQDLNGEIQISRNKNENKNLKELNESCDEVINNFECFLLFGCLYGKFFF
jgi:hypothetical protein